MKWLERLRTYYVVKKYPLADHLWLETTDKLPLLATLDAVQMAKLRVLSTLLIHRKTFFGAHEFDVTPEMEIIIAAQACVEILELGIDSFNGWEEIVVYPGAFKVEREVQDDFGLVSNEQNVLSGEAWGQGPVILSWDDVERDSYTIRAGHNVVIHEFAHKLDMLNGRANGMPPLHPDMPIEKWTESLSSAYQHLNKRLEHHHTEVNAYAATNPAEFFAVMCEYFFTAPDVLKKYYPKVFKELRAYFRREHAIKQQ
jgi:Mlc titration factor MtfA (ptsG expression regulator)